MSRWSGVFKRDNSYSGLSYTGLFIQYNLLFAAMMYFCVLCVRMYSCDFYTTSFIDINNWMLFRALIISWPSSFFLSCFFVILLPFILPLISLLAYLYVFLNGLNKKIKMKIKPRRYDNHPENETLVANKARTGREPLIPGFSVLCKVHSHQCPSSCVM